MTAPGRRPDPPASASLAVRLRERFGREVDPRIDLAPVKEGAPRSTAPVNTPGSTVLDRLGARGSASSRYRMHGEIARGGMGAILEVYDEDLRRKLAMKVILDRESGGADTASVDPSTLARFLEEAQVTGQLDHPGIVPVHELGLDAEGRVYFTMRLVHGRDLETIFLDVAHQKGGWTVTRALDVLLKVCDAVAYAHDRGVVHRDLKPPNVMVGRFGEVYVMDWGLARVRAQGGHRAEADVRVVTDRREGSGAFDAQQTMEGDAVGTPSYMAPEQARGDVEHVDERADVYSLGAMLYRLLAGLAPYTSHTVRLSGTEVLEKVRKGPPERLDSIAPWAPAELVAICDKAMARELEQRYPNVLAFSEDLRAFHEGRVVRAFETGAVAELRKWVSRNRGLAAALGLAVLSLTGGLVASLVLGDRARESAELAETQRKAADESAQLAETRRVQAEANANEAARQARIAKEANDFLNTDLLAAVAPEHQGIDVTVREILDQAEGRLSLRFVNEPEVESALRMTIGTSYAKLGEYEKARAHYERAHALRLASEGASSENRLEAALGLAGALAELDRRNEAIALYRDVIGVARERLGPKHRAVATAAGDLALVLERAGEVDEARDLFETALELDNELLGREHRDTLAVENNLALFDGRQGRHADALARMRSVLQRREEQFGAEHPETLEAANNLATILNEAGEYAESEAIARETLERMLEVLGEDHPRVAAAKGNLGLFLDKLGRKGEAIELLEEALHAQRKLLGEDHALTLLARHNLAVAAADPKRLEESLEEHRSIFAARRRVLGDRHEDTLNTMDSIAGALRAMKRYDEAEVQFREVLTLKEEVLGADHPNTIITRENLAGALFEGGRPAESEPLVRAVLESRRRVLGPAHPDTAKTEFNLSMALKGLGRRGEALEMVRMALDHTREAVGGEHPQAVTCLRTLGDLCSDAKELDQAEAAYREGLAAQRKLAGDDELAAYFLHQIGYVRTARKDWEGALPILDEALALRESLYGKNGLGTRVTLVTRARALLELDRFAEAEPVALDFHARSKRAKDSAAADHVSRARTFLFDLYTRWEKPDEAEKWK